jgi:hypothetical protein
MTTYDINQVKEFSAEVIADLDRCENEIRCDSIDRHLDYYAERCCTFTEAVRKWGRDVFAGRVAFDPAAESQWRAGVAELYARAQRVLMIGKEAESECGGFGGKRNLESALWKLSQLMFRWVAPKLSVGPSARQEFAFSAEDRARVDSLPSLPADWTPNTTIQANRLARD